MPLQTIPFCGQSYTDRTLVANAQESINLYPMRTPQPSTVKVPQGREQDNIIMYPTPGYNFAQACASFATLGTGIRGLFVINNILYIICGNVLLSFTPTGLGNNLAQGTFATLGTLNTSSGICSIVCNTVQLAISDGVNGYTYTFSSNAFAAIGTGGAFPSSGGCTNFTFYDGYTIAALNNSQEIIQSNVLDASTWQALAFDKITTFADNLVGVFSDELSLYCFGPQKCEVQVDVGSIPYAFQKIAGVLIQSGCLAVNSIKLVANTIIWLASDIAGSPFVASMEGYAARPISTPAVNEAIARYTKVSDAFAWSYREADNHFYCITFPTPMVTWCYDIKMDMWHKRSIAGGADLPQAYIYWQGNHVVGDASGNLYTMSQNYSWYGNGAGQHDIPLTRTRVTQHIIVGGMTAFIRELQIDFQVGYGFTPDPNLVYQPPITAVPLVTLEVSRDFGNIWHNVGSRTLGAVGTYNTRVIWRNLGRFRKAVTFRLTISDPVAVFITGARADILVGKK